MSSILDVCSELTLGTNDNTTKVDFIGKGNIWIDNNYEQSVQNLSKSIIAQAIAKTAPGQLSIIGYDSDLSGIFAPFSSLSSGESKILELIANEEQLKTYLDYIWQHICAVQNVVQGRTSSLLQFREQAQRPIESYKLVVLSLDMGVIDNDIRAKLSTLMRRGPDNGVSFMIVSTTIMTIQTQNGNEIELNVSALSPNITVLELNENTIKIQRTNDYVHHQFTNAHQLIDFCNKYNAEIKKSQLPIVNYDEIHQSKEMWSNNSIDGLTFSIGMFGINRMDITIGDELNQRHNAIITGAVGQGKSNLISVIIHSLCQRYSPSELQMYLLDFKEGVTFKAFSNINQKEFFTPRKSSRFRKRP